MHMNTLNTVNPDEKNENLQNYAKEMQQEYGYWDDNWRIHSLIGVGSQGKVFKLINKDNPLYPFTALKIIFIADSIVNKKAKEIGYSKNNIRKNIMSILAEIIPEVKLYERINTSDYVMRIFGIKALRSKDNIGWNVFIHTELLTNLETSFLNKQISESDIYQLSLDICHALVDCQESHIIHGDVKPSNIFVDGQGRYKLGDFGTAFEFASDRKDYHIGTLSFMAPEAISHFEYDYSSDVYSLGITLYVLLNNNRLPFASDNEPSNETIKDVINMRVNGYVFSKPAFASEAFSKIILKAISFNKKDRYANAKELLADLNKIIDKINTTTIGVAHFLSDSTFVNTIISKDPITVTGINNAKQAHMPNDQTFDASQNQSAENHKSKKHSGQLGVRLINWIFTCVFASLPIFIFLLITNIFTGNYSIVIKITTELLYFGLSIAIINIRELVSNEYLKKRSVVYLLSLFLMLSIIVFCSISFGVMTMNELNILNDSISEASILWISIILSSVSFISGTALQIWEEV